MTHLLGFADFETDSGSDSDSVGASKQAPAGKPQPKSQSKPQPKPQAPVRGLVKARISKEKGGKSPHQAAMVNAIDAGKRAIDASKKAKARAKAYRPSDHAPLVKLAATPGPGGKVVLGAAAPKSLTPKQQAAVRKHAKAIGRRAELNKQMNLSAAKAKRAGESALAFTKKAIPLLKNKLSGAGQPKTRIHGVPDDVELGAEIAELNALNDTLELYEMLGAEEDSEEIGADANGLSPGDPGYDPSTDPGSGGAGDGTDFAAAGPASVDASTGIVTDASGNVIYDPANDPAILKMPERGGKLTPAEMQVAWQHMPEDAIPLPAGTLADGAVGSYQWFQTPTKVEDGILKSAGKATGYIYTRRGTRFGSDRAQPRWMGQNNDGQVHDVNDDGSIKGIGWTDVMLAFLVPFGDIAGFAKAAAGGGDPTAAKIAAASIGAGWGPLIGNPNDPRYAGLQFAILDGLWFWQSRIAPAEAAAEADAQIMLANKKTIEANTAAALAKAAQQAADAADAAEAKAKQDAENALRESAAASEANIAQQKQQTEMSQQDIERQKQQDAGDAAQRQQDIEYQKQQDAAEAAYRQQELEERKAELEYLREQAKLDAQAQHEIIKQAEIWNKWAEANPEQAVAQMNEALPLLAEDEAELADEFASDAGDGQFADFSQGEEEV